VKKNLRGLAAMHTLFLREHNRIADVFASFKHRGWSDHEIYQVILDA